MTTNLQADSELGDALQAELVRRVMALEGREDTLRIANVQLETTVDALDECTNVSRKQILAMAEELARDSTIDNTLGLPPVGISNKPNQTALYALIGVVVVSICAVLIFYKKPPEPIVVATADPSVSSLPAMSEDTVNLFRLKAVFAGAMGDVSPLRMMVVMRHQTHEEYPANFEELGMDASTLTSRHVTRVELESGGTIVTHLPMEFGAGKWMKLTPRPAMGGMTIEWDCVSNVHPSVLSSTQCEPSDT